MNDHDDLNATQVAAMQSVDDAVVIEQVIRDGHPHGARKRLTAARRRAKRAGHGPTP